MARGRGEWGGLDSAASAFQGIQAGGEARIVRVKSTDINFRNQTPVSVPDQNHTTPQAGMPTTGNRLGEKSTLAS